jgi:hypothetical protein
MADLDHVSGTALRVSHGGPAVTPSEGVPTLLGMSGQVLTKRRSIDLCRVATCLCCMR